MHLSRIFSSKNLAVILVSAVLTALFPIGGAFGAQSDSTGNVTSSDDKTEEKFDPSKVIMHHVSEAHEWHIAGPLALYLPVILYTEDGRTEERSVGNECGRTGRYRWSPDQSKKKKVEG